MRGLATVSIASARGDFDNLVSIFERNKDFDTLFCQSCIGSFELIVFRHESVKQVAIPVEITSYSLEALHADASRLAHAIGPNLIEIRKFGDIRPRYNPK